PAVKEALKLGYRHIDCAHIYSNEGEIGEVFEECFKPETGVCKREDVFITSKLWCTDQYPDRIVNACKLSLKNLKLEYLDLYLIHWAHAIVPDIKIIEGKGL
uniref:aldo/keto reductase n=1 Tax=Salmonella sp. s51228 TaxID=3159652 RepID=UPI0039809599